ncbi:hypothetical protein VTL71DRAFT_2970 [Oculimacula yallundae]
MPNAFNR